MLYDNLHICSRVKGVLCMILKSGVIRTKRFIFLFSHPRHTARTDAHICVKNYNSDTNSKDIITVDYLITGGRLFVYNKWKIAKTVNVLSACNPIYLKFFLSF